MNLVSAVEFLPFGVLVGALARVLTIRRPSGGWARWMLVGGCGALVGGLSDRFFGFWPEEGPQGFATSLLGALVFVVAYQVGAYHLRPKSRALT
jgi:uncharacterized membrane protein YeaQ/YmgE (transglycosylase-associated protein family)